MLQSDSLSTGLPIENSPPGIHTIPGGAAPGRGPGLGLVGVKVSDSLGNTHALPRWPGWRDQDVLMACSVTAVVTTPSASNQPARNLRFEFLFRMPASGCPTVSSFCL